MMSSPPSPDRTDEEFGRELAALEQRFSPERVRQSVSKVAQLDLSQVEVRAVALNGLRQMGYPHLGTDKGFAFLIAHCR